MELTKDKKTYLKMETFNSVMRETSRMMLFYRVSRALCENVIFVTFSTTTATVTARIQNIPMTSAISSRLKKETLVKSTRW